MHSVIVIDKTFITLGQFLKKINIVSSGGMAKNFLETHKILVNNINEDKRGRKLYRGDEIIINNELYIIETK